MARGTGKTWKWAKAALTAALALCLTPWPGNSALKAQEAVSSSYPKNEVRAAWITTAYSLDWPRTKASSPQQAIKQQQELIEILDRLKIANFNTVLFQARLRGDVSYGSSIEAFSSEISGKAGREPYYDPLAFAVEQCHKRGMECHAWFVAIPIGNAAQVRSLGNSSVVKKRPAITLRFGSQYYLNPGHPDTKVYLMSLIREIVSGYDVDGIHMDYLRYPSPMRNFPDGAQFRQYGKGRSIDQWRRDNITEIVRYIYKGVKDLKPWVKVSTSPVGKYADTPRYSSKGWNAYNEVKQDVKGWLAEGIQDQIYPMQYFKGDNYYPFLLDWTESARGRHVISGQGTYFLDPKEGNWSLDEIHRQVLFSRRHGAVGQSQYRVEYLMNNQKGVYDLLKDNLYRYPALQPPMPWLDNEAPSMPGNLTVTFTDKGSATLSWEASSDNDSRNRPSYTIYASNTYPVDTTRPENIIATQVATTTYSHMPILPWQVRKYYAVTAIDRYGNESEASQSGSR